jgi:hypothetical protein
MTKISKLHSAGLARTKFAATAEDEVVLDVAEEFKNNYGLLGIGDRVICIG